MILPLNLPVTVFLRLSTLFFICGTRTRKTAEKWVLYAQSSWKYVVLACRVRVRSHESFGGSPYPWISNFCNVYPVRLTWLGHQQGSQIPAVVLGETVTNNFYNSEFKFKQIHILKNSAAAPVQPRQHITVLLFNWWTLKKKYWKFYTLPQA